VLLKRKSILFTTVIYSVLAVLLILLTVVVFVLSSLGTMTDLHNFFLGSIKDVYSETTLYFIIGMLIVAIYAIVQMLRRKIHGMYLFFFLSAIVIIFILQFQSIDLVNVINVLVINYIFFINRKWFILIDAIQEIDEDLALADDEQTA